MKDKFNNTNDIELTNLSDKNPHEIGKNVNKINLLNNKNEKDYKIDSKKNNFFCYKKGNTYIITVDKYNNPILTIGPERIFFVIFILFITGLFLFLFIYYYKYTPLYLFILGIIIYLIFIIVYTKMFISNPGFAKNIKIEKGKDNYLYCRFCDIHVEKNTKTVHCSKCGLCVEEFNHHCGWIGKCIGKNNLYEFYFLIFWIFVIILYYSFAFTIVHYNWFDYEMEFRKNKD